MRGAEVYDCGLAGEGVRERRVGAERFASEGAEGDVKPRFICFPGACNCNCEREALLPWLLRLGYRGFEPPVRSRKECCAACGVLRELGMELREPSNSRRFGDGSGMGKEFGPCPSSRLMSSKCDRSLGPMTSDMPDEWKLDDLEDLELVRSGGLPGGPIVSGEYVRVVMRGRGSFLFAFCCSMPPMRRREEARFGAACAQKSREGINEWT